MVNPKWNQARLTAALGDKVDCSLKPSIVSDWLKSDAKNHVRDLTLTKPTGKIPQHGRRRVEQHSISASVFKIE